MIESLSPPEAAELVKIPPSPAVTGEDLWENKAVTSSRAVVEHRASGEPDSTILIHVWTEDLASAAVALRAFFAQGAEAAGTAEVPGAEEEAGLPTLRAWRMVILHPE